jgi:hypothetical protein
VTPVYATDVPGMQVTAYATGIEPQQPQPQPPTPFVEIPPTGEQRYLESLRARIAALEEENAKLRKAIGALVADGSAG